MNKILRKNEKGITLIALVVTIVVLIILAVISVNAVLGENGIIRRAEQAKILKSHGEVTEGIKLACVDYEFEQTTGVTAKVEETKLASIKVASARARTETFLEFLTRKEYTNEYDVVNVVKLLGHSTGIGNGDSESDVYSDIYVIEDTGDNYELNYYDKDGEKLNLWVVAKPEDTTIEDEEDDELCPDCGMDPCECEDFSGEDDACPDCGMDPCECEDFSGEDDACPDCGMNPCECEGYCQDCKEAPCICDGTCSTCGGDMDGGLCNGCAALARECSCCPDCGFDPCVCGECQGCGLPKEECTCCQSCGDPECEGDCVSADEIITTCSKCGNNDSRNGICEACGLTESECYCCQTCGDPECAGSCE